MKRVIFIFALVSLFTQISCEAQSHTTTEVTKNTQNIPNEFEFQAERANPSIDGTKVLNQLPGASVQQIVNINRDRGFILTKDSLKINLPYYGRVYNATQNTATGFQSISTKFSVERTDQKKKTIFTIRPSDIREINRIVIEAFPNGRAYVSIACNDRRPISYDGVWITTP